jgi:hypothetical protein
VSDATRTDQIINRLKNNKLIAILIALGVVLIGVGTVTDSASNLWKLFGSKDAEVITLQHSIGISVKNETNQDKRIFNFSEFFLTESEVLMIREHSKGRVFLKKVGGKGLSEDYVIPANGEVTYQAVLPNLAQYEALMERGGENIHFVIQSTELKDEIYIETVPFHKEMFSGGWYIEFKIQRHNKAIQPTPKPLRGSGVG